MKKILFVLICGLFSSSVFAQENISKSGWYVQGLIGPNTTGTESLSLGTNIGLAGSIEGGYLFNPYISLGLQIQYNRSIIKNHVDLNNYGERVGFDAYEPSLNFYWDLTNTFLRYIPNRKNHVRLYAGATAAFTNAMPGGYATSDVTGNGATLGFRGGVQYERNLGKFWAFVADASINCFGDKFDSDHASGNSLDSHANLMVGVRRYIGMGSIHKHRSDYKETIVNTVYKRDTIQIKDIVETSAPKDMYSIFFDIDKIDIRSSEVSKIKAIANFLQAHPEKVVFVFGYADKNTGTTQRNEWLAKNRARVICEQLTKKYGIDSSRIITTDQGDKVQPFSEDEYEKNRSTICIITDLKR